MKKYFLPLSKSIILALFLGACSGFSVENILPAFNGTAVPVVNTPASDQAAPVQGTQSPEPTSGPSKIITIWVPPFLNPDDNSKAGNLFKERLGKFMQENPGIQVKVRVKNISGQGGLLDSLTTSGAAAPLAVPSLIFLPRTDFENAALKGLLFPIDEIIPKVWKDDWYLYAKQMAVIQGQAFGLPFFGDALVIIYRPEKVGYPTSDWKQLFSIGQGLIFPAADPRSIFCLSLYQSTGGSIKNEIGQPEMDPEKLRRVFNFFQTGAKQGVFPYWLTQYEDDTQSLQAYQEMKANMLITWISNYLRNLPADTIAMPIPPFEGGESTSASGWVLALSDPIAEHQSTSMRLAEYLVDSEFLAQWTSTSGYLPTRPSELPVWNNQSVQLLVNHVAQMSIIIPTSDVLNSVGPVLQEATIQVLKQQSSPDQASKNASELLNQTQVDK